MSDRLDALIATKYQKNGEEKTRYQRVGAAFSTRNGGWSIKFDAPTVIVPGMGDLVLFPPREQPQGNSDPQPF